MANRLCPLGFNNSMCNLPDSPCENYRFCDYQTLSWGLPYILENGVLVVSNLPSIYQWTRTISDFPIFKGGLYYTLEIGDFHEIIRRAWQEAGWYPAVYNSNYHSSFELSCKILNSDYDPIPF